MSNISPPNDSPKFVAISHRILTPCPKDFLSAMLVPFISVRLFQAGHEDRVSKDKENLGAM